MSVVQNNEENCVFMGKPTLDETKEYLLKNRNGEYLFNESSTSEESTDLDESFKDLLHKRFEEINIQNMNKHNEYSFLNETENPNISRMNNLGGDETFAVIEKLCEIDEDSLDRKDQEKFEEICGDTTQLNEVEEPSALWENSIANLTKMSPVKLCGMFRPSTIIEEETQYDTSLSRNTQNNSKISTSSINTDVLVELLNNDQSKELDANLSIDLINLDNTNLPSQSLMNSNSNKSNSDTECNIININNATDESYMTAEGSYMKQISETSSETSTKETYNSIWVHKPRKNIFYDDDGNLIDSSSANTTNYKTANTINNSSEVIELSSDSSPENSKTKKIDNNTLEDISSLKDESSLFTDSLESNQVKNIRHKDMVFNDTLEEMDYMIQEGLKIMEKQNVLTPKPNKSGATPKSFKPRNINSPKSASKQDSNLKFKRPVTKLAQPKSGKKPTSYDHIVSPIGVYIKKTPVVPLVASDKSRKDIFQSKLAHIRTSSFYNSSLEQATKENLNKSFTTCPFPRKAYVGAESNHVIDQRLNSKIHGGEKVHRLFGNHQSPTTIRHESRMNSNKPKSHKVVDTEKDTSFQDLSIVSGDISVLVMRNANKY